MTTYIKDLNNALAELLSEDEMVYLVGEDICDPYGGAFKVTKGLSTRFPRRLYNTPISEAGITGLGVGMALRGYRPVIEIMFGDFLTLAADQIISNISKIPWMFNEKVTLPLVIRTPMGARRGYGPTHSQSLEKLFMGIPRLKIVSPSIMHSPGTLLKSAVRDDEPVIFIEYKTDYGKELVAPAEDKRKYWAVRATQNQYPGLQLSPVRFEECGVAVVTYGGMVSIVENAVRRLLYESEIVCEMVVLSLIKPCDIELIANSLKRSGKVVIVEEGTLGNGWGSEIAAQLADKYFHYLKAPIKRVASKEVPIGCAAGLEEATVPGVDDVMNAVKEIA